MKAFATAAFSVAAIAALITGADATTCDQAVYKCKTEANRQTDGVARCEAAGEQCKKSGGDWVSPFTGKRFKLSTH